jgi:hypothetical protein
MSLKNSKLLKKKRREKIIKKQFNYKKNKVDKFNRIFGGVK